MSLTNFGENAALNALFRAVAPVIPTHIGLLTSDPGEPGSGASEVSGGSYARQAIGTPGTFWSAASGGEISNAAAVEFPTATGSWGTVSHFALFDAASGGNMIASAPLATAKAFDTDDTPRFAAGTLKMTAE